MCGIIGLCNIKNADKIVRVGLKFMNYRGMDGTGIVSKSDFTFGHCLHSIVGNVKQPIGTKNIFAANCEVYNWENLRNNHKINAKNDSELFYFLLDKIGIDKTLELVDGDYACAYFKENKIYLFRDLFGVKPLWYTNENGFAFASEKKVLESLGYRHIDDLNPRKILIYDLKTKKIKFTERKFFEIKPEHDEDYDKIKKITQGLLINAITKRIPGCKFGLLFSGGVDSAFIALVLKQLGISFKCYICVLDEPKFNKPKDLESAERIAKELELDLEIVKVKLNDVENNIGKIVNIIESSNITKLGVALPFYFATKRAGEEGCKVMFSGLGSEEIFAGYERHKNSGNVNKECYSGLLWLYERDLYRDDAVSMANNVEIRVPFLDKALVDYALKIPAKFKLNEENNKIILRGIANSMGLNKEFAFRKKVAAQYGSNFDKAIDKLARQSKFKTKSEYVNQFYNKPNVKLGVLFSGGKDSTYAMHVMYKQNYSIECLISMKSKNKDSFMFHTPNIDFVKYQSMALEIPLVMGVTQGKEEYELEDLKKVLEKAKKKHKIQGIITGALFSSYQRDRIEKICESIGLKVFSPLWHKTQEQELKEIVKEGFEVIIIAVAADGFNKTWLGRKIDMKTIDELKKLNHKVGINVAAEGGEYETFVLDAPMFKKKLEIKKAKAIMDGEYSGVYFIEKIELKDKL